MEKFLNRLNELVNLPLNLRSRILAALAVLFLVPTYFVPLWHLHLWSYQYPDGLDMYIYSHTLEGGRDNADLQEINILNHYIGMAALEEDDFPELQWIPFALGAFIILCLRAVVLGTTSKLLDVLVLSAYFGGFSLLSFYQKLYAYGHNLDPRAAMKLEPFTPPIFGLKDLAQFKVWSYPAAGTYLVLAFTITLVLAMLLTAVPYLRNNPLNPVQNGGGAS